MLSVVWSYLSNGFCFFEEIQVSFSRLQNELQTLAQKIGELESEAEEHE